MRVIARCVHGMEWICADEVSSALAPAGLAPAVLTMERRELTFSVESSTPALLGLRTVDDVFAEVGRFAGVSSIKAGLPDLSRRLEGLPWTAVIDQLRRIRPVPDAPVIDVVASLEGRRSYNRFDVEQAAGDMLSSLLGGKYLRRKANGRESGDPSLTVRLFLRAGQVIAALRVGAEPAHRRAYKLDTGPGTLHPPMAAALARLGCPAPGSVVLDPFAGDGTIAIETALAHPFVRVLARDADTARVASTVRNAERAGVEISAAVADSGAGGLPAADVVITNPPWNVAVDAAGALTGSLDPFWRALTSVLGSPLPGSPLPGSPLPGSPPAAGRVVVLAETALEVPKALSSMGFALGVVQPVRVSGRIAQVLLASPPGAPPPPLSAGLREWKARAEESGVLLAPPTGR